MDIEKPYTWASVTRVFVRGASKVKVCIAYRVSDYRAAVEPTYIPEEGVGLRFIGKNAIFELLSLVVEERPSRDRGNRWLAADAVRGELQCSQ